VKVNSELQSAQVSALSDVVVNKETLLLGRPQRNYLAVVDERE
jgi:hypothetical protein